MEQTDRFELVDEPELPEGADQVQRAMSLRFKLNGETMTVADVLNDTAQTDDGWRIKGTEFEAGHRDFKSVFSLGLITAACRT